MTGVRPMGREDAAAAAAISLKCLEEAWSEKSFLESLCIPGAVFAVYEDEAQITGYAAVYTAADQAELVSVAVSREARRQGRAGKLLAFVTEEAKRRGVVQMTLEVRGSNLAARLLYEKFGFEILGKRKRFYKCPEEDALIFGSNLRYQNQS